MIKEPQMINKIYRIKITKYLKLLYQHLIIYIAKKYCHKINNNISQMI